MFNKNNIYSLIVIATLIPNLLSANDWELTIQSHSSNFALSQPINLHLTLKNVSKKDQQVILSNDFYDHIVLSLKTQSNREVQPKADYYLKMADRQLAENKVELENSVPLQQILLKPNSSVGFDIDLKKCFDINKQGKYLIQAKFYPAPIWQNTRYPNPAENSKLLNIDFSSGKFKITPNEDEEKVGDIFYPMGRKSPVEAIEYLLNNKLENNINSIPDSIFDVINIEQLITAFPLFYSRFSQLQGNQKTALVKQFKEYIKSTFLNGIQSYEVLQTLIVKDRAKITVSLNRRGNIKKENKMVSETYTFNLQKVQRGKESHWIIYHYNVSK